MKKLKLKAVELGAEKVLSREELKKVLGGDYGSGGGGTCTSDSDCGEHTVQCPSGTQVTVQSGRCYANPGQTEKKCHWSAVCY